MGYFAYGSWPVDLVGIQDAVTIEMVDHKGGYSVRAGLVGHKGVVGIADR